MQYDLAIRRILQESYKLLALLVLVCSQLAFADGLPEILAHSKRDITVYKGDVVTLEVKGQGPGVEAKWLGQDKLLCRDFNCTIDTSMWKLGSHRLVFVIFNKKGSLSLQYRLRILAAPAGYKPSRFDPGLKEEVSTVETTAEDDFTVQTIAGRGFSYSRGNVQVVGPHLRRLEWKESLRTQVKSSLYFGAAGREAHMLAPKSAVKLATSQSGRRAIILAAGALRSRHFAEESPRFSILVGDWVQIDTDALGDVLVKNLGGGSEKVQVLTLRGHARIVWHSGSDSDDFTGQALTVPQGVMVELSKSDKVQPPLVAPVAREVELLIAETAPQYLLSTKAQLKQKTPLQANVLIKNKAPTSFTKAMQMARESLRDHDPILALEIMLPFENDAKKSATGSTLIGEAYSQIYLYRLAKKWLMNAVEIDPEGPRPYFLLGMMELSEKQWSRAVDYLENAAKYNFEDGESLSYYLGVAYFRTGSKLRARQYFNYALWQTSRSEVESSVKQHLDLLKEKSWFELYGLIGVFSDSNVLRAGQLDTVKSDVTILQSTDESGLVARPSSSRSTGWLAKGGISVWPYRTDGGVVEVAFDIERKGYANPGLRHVEPIAQQFLLGLGLNFGDSPSEPLLTTRLDSFIGMIYLGDERAMDWLGSALTLKSPRFYGIGTFVDIRRNIDPLPGRDDVYDPILGEVVLPSERTNTQTTYGFFVQPVQESHLLLDLQMKKSKFTYVKSVMADDNEQLSFAGKLSWLPSLRTNLGVKLAHDQRSFPSSTDDRKDRLLTVMGDWKWHYTPSFYQLLELSNERQNSNRKANAFSRQLYTFKIGISL